MQCPRRAENWYGSAPQFAKDDDLDPEDDTCGYCGSLNPDTFMARLETGDLELGPTDKNYKAYLRPINGGPLFKHRTRTDGGGIPWERRDEWTYKVSESAWGKFYFQHLSEAQMRRFVELLNEKKLHIGEPGYFYRTPFFIKQG